MRRILTASIWAKDSIPLEEWKYRNLKRVLLPFIDFMYFLGGLSAARYGIPAISQFFPDWFVDHIAYALSIVAIACLVGVSFPKLWPVEVLAKSALTGLMAGYVCALFLLTSAGEGNRGFVLVIAIIAVGLPVWRLTLLGAEWQTRHAEEREAQEAADLAAKEQES